MKKIFIPISTLFVVGISYAQASNTENYVQSRTYLEPVTTSSSTARQIETVQYFDGLGRPKQVVNVKASPTGKDVVSHIEYDGFGRQVKDYLPVPQSNTLNGGIVPNPLANATQTDIYGSEKIYAEKILENSPLDRLKQQIQVGNDWTSKPVKFDYDANAVSDYVRKYETTTTWVDGRTQTSVQLLQYFQPSQLYKNTITDEDGNKTIEFKNGQGQTLLVRKVLSATENADTYYVYNEYNQLAFVIPPLASAPTVESSTVENLYYQYRYDGRNRLVEKKLPGKGWEYMVYDKQDRLVLTQDSNLREQGKWLFTKYDQFSRPIYTGILDSPPGRIQQVAAVESMGSNNEVRLSSSWNNSNMDVFYTTGSAYPAGNFKLLSVNYYDIYPVGSPAIPTQILGQNILHENAQLYNISTKSFPVASYVKNIEDDNWTKNYTWYDQKGRSVASHSINHLGGYTKTESLLDFSGTLLQAVTKHKRLDSDTERIITENFTYDHQNRLLTHTHQVDSNPVEYLAQNEYNPLSQLKNKKVGGASLGSELQSIDYTYNIRGWMTKINDPANLFNGKLFGYEIKYTNPENTGLSTARFNGNIAEIDWKTSTNPNDNKRRYSYTYDLLNRLQQGVYSEPGSSLISNDYYNEQLTYDLNGNIKTLKRFSKPYAGTTAEKIDDLIYNYTGNRLDKITLPPGEVNNFSGYNAGLNVISYDNNGNMTDHKDKNISNIEYNYLNLPTFVNAVVGGGWGLDAEGQLHTYKYNANGIKYYTRVDDVSPYMQQYSINEYLDGFQYQQRYTKMNTAQNPYDTGLVLKFYPTNEGYFDFEKNKYIYNYTDHLGNIRLSYLHNGSSLQVIEENNYYPFGLRHNGYNILSGNYGYNYKYNGKELQETGMYDYGARFYMPDIGRWGVVDPLAEKMTRHSPYNYGFNNPIRFIDPDGREGTGWIEQFDLAKGKSYTYDPNVNTVAQAKAAGYSGVSNVYKSATIQGSSSIAGVEINHYSYSLNGDGTVMDNNGRYQNSAFATDKGTAIGGMTFQSQLPVGGIMMVGGAGDVTGAFEVGGMILGSSDSDLKYAIAPILLVKGQGDDALKLLGAAKGSLSGTKGALAEAKSMIGLEASEALPKMGTGKFGSPQRGTGLKGYRLDPAHPNAKPGTGEEFPHVNYWDYTGGKRGKGGISGAIPIKY